MQGRQTIKLSLSAIIEAATDYLNKHVVHKEPIVVSDLGFEGNSIVVEFEENATLAKLDKPHDEGKSTREDSKPVPREDNKPFASAGTVITGSPTRK